MTEVERQLRGPRRRPGPKPRPNMGGQIAVARMPRSIKQRLIAAAEERGTNINDIAVAAVAKKLKVSFTETGKRSPVPPGIDGAMLLTMPKQLEIKVKVAAARSDLSLQDVIIAILAEADL